MLLLGPVANASRGGTANPWFSIGVGTVVLVSAWVSYLRRDDRSTSHVAILVGITCICLVFIISGVWDLFHAAG
jgi:hypothetical protein